VTAHEKYAEDLALFALGELDSQLTAEVEAHLEECAACRSELQLLRGDMALLGLSSAGPQRTTRPTPRHSSQEDSVPTAMRRRRWRMLAPLLTTLVLALFAILLWRDNADMRRRTDALSTQLTAQQRAARQAENVLAAMGAPEASQFTLASPGSTAAPVGRVFYNAHRGALIFLGTHLQPLPADQIYQLWLLPPDGPPLAAASFLPDAGGNVRLTLPRIPRGVEARSFAVSIEPQGGSHAPTTPYYLEVR
jgi:anti-sigma factor RsiW